MRTELARYDDLPAVDALLSAGRAYLRAQGLDQWQNHPPAPQETRAHFERKELFVVREGDAVIGTFVLVHHEPAYDRIDGAWQQNGAYVAVHRVAVAPEFRRHGVATAIFAAACAVARESGAKAVRIDTHRDNRPMRTALERNGFVLCGTVINSTGETRVAYEKCIKGEQSAMKHTAMKVVAATGNAHKLREFREIFPDWEIISEKEAGFSEDVAETGTTFAENALIKARAVCRATGLAALADDSGISVDALNGAPGVYSARYSGGDDADNRALLLKNLTGVTDRRAHFTSAVALVCPDGREVTAEGKTYGSILYEERGNGGFGYDCLFYSDDLGKSLGEATEEEKNSVSHRGRALSALLEKLA